MPNKEEKQHIVIYTQGGSGDIIASTPMLRCIHRDYPNQELVVVTTYPVILKDNPNISKVFPFNEGMNVYSEYKDTAVMFKKRFAYDYFRDEHRAKSKNILDFICNVYDTKWDGDPPEVFLTKHEREFGQYFMSQFKKPVILIHAFGAVPSEGQSRKIHAHKDMRMDLISELVRKYSKHFEFVQIGLAGEQLVEGAFDALGMQMRETFAIIDLCKTFVFIESLFAHYSACINKTGVVLFNNTDPRFFGHPHNININAPQSLCDEWPCNRPVGALLDLEPGYLNPKTRERNLWTCKRDIVCNQIPYATLESAFLRAIEKNTEKDEKSA
ncbi:MAG: hypothetical protein WC444_05295 [Candidatus Paceibacterota bacterium]